MLIPTLRTQHLEQEKKKAKGKKGIVVNVTRVTEYSQEQQFQVLDLQPATSHKGLLAFQV